MTNKENAKENVKENVMPAVKLCIRCNSVKSLEINFYRAGPSWQKLCKICHNERRLEYKFTRAYVIRPTGFKKLPEELRKKIIYDVYVRLNYRDICRKYKDEYKNLLKYQTLLRWANSGQIPKYALEEVVTTGIAPAVTEGVESSLEEAVAPVVTEGIESSLV